MAETTLHLDVRGRPVGTASRDAAVRVPAEGRHGERLPVGRIIGKRYRVLDTLGTGSLGTVYLCDDVERLARVAVKVFRRELSRDDEFMRHLRRQARCATEVGERHPGVLAVQACDRTDDGDAFVVAEYLQGTTLRDLIRACGPLDVQRTLRLACQVAEGLDIIHGAGFVHGDIRTSNVIVSTRGEDEIATLKGFEVAGLRDTALVDHLIRGGMVPLQAEYLAPERIEGGGATARSDIYAFGVVLYEMLGGRVPFDGATADGIMAKHLQDAPLSLAALRQDIPSVLDLRIAQALEKDPEKRQRYAGDIVNECLCELAAEEQAEAARGRRATLGGRLAALVSRGARNGERPEGAATPGVWWKVGAAAALAAAVAVLAMWGVSTIQRPPGVGAARLDERSGAPADASPRPAAETSYRLPPPLADAPTAQGRGTLASRPPLDNTVVPESARRATSRERVRGQRTPPRPAETSLLPPGARGRMSSGRGAGDTGPADIRPHAAASGEMANPSALRQDAPRARGSQDGTAIIDWLLGRPGGAE